MGEKNLWSKVGLIVLLVGLSIWQVFPLREKLKPGIDLGGGYSALFEIDDTNAKNEPDLAERVMEVLKQRIDPGSTRNLVWRPIGRNRLEIQMPVARGVDKGVRQKYQSVRDRLLETNLNEAEIRAALTMTPSQRDAKFEQMVRGIDSRKALFEQLSAADDRYRHASAALAETQPAATQPAQAASTQPGEEIGAILEKRHELIEKLLATNLNVSALVDRLELTDKARRTKEIETVKKAHPELAGLIDEMVVTYDEWSKQRGVLEDPSDLLRLLKGAGVLEFRILATRDASNPSMLTSPKPEYNVPVERYVEQLAQRGPRPEAGDLYAWFKIAKPKENSIAQNPGYYVVSEYLGEPYVLAHATSDMALVNDKSWSLVRANASRDRTGRPSVNFELDPRGGDKFGQLTTLNKGRPLSIFLDNEAISAATINDTILTRGEITGNFTPQEVAYLVNTLEAGALPARLKETPIQERHVGPSLGITNIRKGLIAVTVSLAVVIIFMTLYYGYNGAIADVALLMNLIITVGAMSFLGATFTLPGIAGLILTLGMAVDANVLIFERMREELQRGVSAKMAVKLGYERAFSAIFDGNVTTIITAGILYWIGSEEIKGFGLTLGLGLAISLFTALFVTRQYYYVMLPLSLNREETRKAWLLPTILVALCAFIVAVGFTASGFAASAWNESNLVGLGKFLGVMGLTAAVILASMWGFRALYKVTGHQRANRLPMMKLMSAPTINWMGMYRKFWVASSVVIVAGLIFLAELPKKQILDIEFIGGTDVQVQLKKEYHDVTDEQLAQYISGDKHPTAVDWLHTAADQLRKVTVSPHGEGTYLVSAADGNLTESQLQALLTARLSGMVGRGGIKPTSDGVLVQFNPGEDGQMVEPAEAERLIKEDAADYAEAAADRMRASRIQSVREEGQAAFDIITTETARTLVAEALMASSLNDLLQVTHAIEADLVTDPERAPDGIFPISRDDEVLADVIGGTARDNIAEYKGGLALVFENLEPATTEKDMEERLQQMRMQPEFEATGWRNFEVIGLGEPAGTTTVNVGGEQQAAPLYNRMAVVVVDPNVIYTPAGPNDTWREQVAEPEKTLAEAALASSQSLQRVTQFAPQVASEATQKAVIALILSFIAIAGYMWVRFGSLEFGISGIIALYHDVAVAIAALLACHYIHDTWLGHLLMLEDFRIDLNIVAAALTLVGFSINDTIVIFDRIRENRGRLGQISPQLVNDALNQTLSRTILTSFTTFMVVAIMYLFGGEGVHGFAFAMVVGVVSGTYSTLAIATPMVLHPRAMWIVTIFIAATTMVGVTWQIENPYMRWVLVLVVVAFAVAGGYRQLAGARDGRAIRSNGRQPAAV